MIRTHEIMTEAWEASGAQKSETTKGVAKLYGHIHNVKSHLVASFDCLWTEEVVLHMLLLWVAVAHLQVQTKEPTEAGAAARKLLTAPPGVRPLRATHSVSAPHHADLQACL